MGLIAELTNVLLLWWLVAGPARVTASPASEAGGPVRETGGPARLTGGPARVTPAAGSCRRPSPEGRATDRDGLEYICFVFQNNIKFVF